MMDNSFSFKTGGVFVSKIISILFFAGLIVSFVDVFTLQFRKDEVEGSFTFISFIHYLPVPLMAAAGLLAFRVEGKNFPRYGRVCFSLLLGIMILLTIRDLPDSLSVKVLLSSKGLSTWLLSSVIFVASNPKRIESFKKFLVYFSLIYSIYLLYQALSLGRSFSRTDSLELLLQLAINLYWIVAFLFINKDEDPRVKMIINICFVIVCFGITLTFTRSYIMQFLLVLGFVFVRQRKKEIFHPKYLLLLLICLMVFVIFLNTSLYDTVDYAINSIMQRSDESTDTRKLQLDEFISQISFNDMLFGAGPNSTWRWSARVEPYAYVDNQFFLLLWFGGIGSLILFLVIFIIPGIRILLKRNSMGKEAAFMSFLWLLSMLGIAIYTTYSNNLYYYVFCVYAGCNLIQQRKSNIKVI